MLATEGHTLFQRARDGWGMYLLNIILIFVIAAIILLVSIILLLSALILAPGAIYRPQLNPLTWMRYLAATFSLKGCQKKTRTRTHAA